VGKVIVNFVRDGVVFVNDDHRVFAKILEIEDDLAEVEFFHSVVEKTVERVPKEVISRFELQKQTRVFVEEQPGHWRVGRVISHLNEENSATIYNVRFPNRENRDIPETDLYVRCIDNFADPAQILASGCAETQLLADLRRSALAQIRKLRSACEGLTGVYSAAIELMPHQLATVRRVLQDTSMRYLLADEVGLGKTIEAGAIIRQVLLDRPNTNVTILVPATLVTQWRHELSSRFYLNPLSDNLRVLSYEEGVNFQEIPDFLIIDEAHRVIATTEDAASLLTRNIEKWAHETDSLLLLSATPALGDETRLFGLLHLLDPVSYPKSDLPGFTKKVENRQKIGRLLLPMRPGGKSFVLRTQANAAKKMFPDDPSVQSFSQEIVDAGDDQASMDRSVLMLRDHIARTYRIHDRLLRSRRVDAEAWAMRPRANRYPDVSHLRYVFDTATFGVDLYSLLEGWRLAAYANDAIDKGDFVERWKILVGACMQGRQALAMAVQNMEVLFEQEADHLNALRKIAVSEDDASIRYEAVYEDLKEWRAAQSTPLPGKMPAKIICYASDKQDAGNLYKVLRNAFGPYDVLSVVDAGDRDTQAEIISAFEIDPESWILVGSIDAEEGLNLQFAHAICHMDLPTSVSRLEQRIGRLDRFGRRIPKIQHRIVLPSDDEDAPWYVWLDFLLNGYKIFNGSVSDVQFKLADLEREVWGRLFEEGSACSEELLQYIEETISDERQKLNEQHALDDLANLNESAEEIIDRMEVAEEDEEELCSSIGRWLNATMELSQSPHRPSPSQDFRLFWDAPLIPEVPWKKILKPALDIPLTWGRVFAQKPLKTTRLLRPGSDLFNALEQLAAWDDRGIAYATWRQDLAVENQWMGFRLVWVLSPKISSETAVWERHERPDLLRRAEGYLPILSIEQIVDIEGATVTDEQILSRLKMPYRNKKGEDGSCDVNLGSRPEEFGRVIDASVFSETLHTIRPICERQIANSDEVMIALDTAKKKLERDATLIERSLRQRQSYLKAEYGQNLVGLDEAMQDLEELKKSLTKPNLRLDEIGFMVISSEEP
jgi:ATP-dependent helicase HepA